MIEESAGAQPVYVGAVAAGRIDHTHLHRTSTVQVQASVTIEVDVVP